jgi:arylsulfatase A-like enzyme
MTLQGAVSGFPLCCPFRGSLVTGRYPHKCVPAHQARLDPKQPTLATPLREAGYHTAWLGKWHLDGFVERGHSQGMSGRSAMHTVPPDARGGFDRWIGFDNNNSQWDCWVHGHDSNGKEVPHYRLPGYETDTLTDLLIGHLEERAENPEQPFFAALSVQPPHDPYVAPEEYMRRWTSGNMKWRKNVPEVDWVREQACREYAGYHAMLANLDHNVGRILAALDRLGQAFDTEIMFFSDHGDMLGSHGQFRKMSPL